MEQTLDESGELIECGEKKGKKSVEEMESVSTTDVPGQGKMKGKPSNECRGTKAVCGCAIVIQRNWKANRMWRKECRIKH